MAKQIIEKLLDDLDGGAADETVTFGLDGKNYEIDLSEKNAKELRTVLEKFVANSRTAPKIHLVSVSRGGRFAPQRTTIDRSQNKGIREWAQRSGYDISDRGRIPVEIVEAYHSNTPNPKAAQATPEEQAEKPAAASQSSKPGKAKATEPAPVLFQSGSKRDEKVAAK